MSARRKARRQADPATLIDPSEIPYDQLTVFHAAYWQPKVPSAVRIPPDDWAFGEAMWMECRARELWRQATEQYLVSVGRDPKREWQAWRREVRA